MLILVDTNNTKLVRLHNKPMSIIYGTVIGMVVIGIVSTIIAIASLSGLRLRGPINGLN